MYFPDQFRHTKQENIQQTLQNKLQRALENCTVNNKHH